MPCTTILVGKKASYDGSTMIARNDDSGAGHYTSKKFVVIHPEEQARTYKTEISHLTIELPDNLCNLQAGSGGQEHGKIKRWGIAIALLLLSYASDYDTISCDLQTPCYLSFSSFFTK